MSVTVLSSAGDKDREQSTRLPMFLDTVSAGFPSPAQDFIESTFNLNELLVPNPPASYFVRAKGESMLNAGINDGDVLIVDRSLEARHGDIVIASVHGELTVKTLETRPQVRLVAQNPRYEPIHIPEGGLELFGVVTYVLHRTRA